MVYRPTTRVTPTWEDQPGKTPVEPPPPVTPPPATTPPPTTPPTGAPPPAAEPPPPGAGGGTPGKGLAGYGSPVLGGENPPPGGTPGKGAYGDVQPMPQPGPGLPGDPENPPPGAPPPGAPPPGEPPPETPPPGGTPGKVPPGGTPPPGGSPGKGGGPTTPSSETPNLEPGDPMLPDPTAGSGFADPNVRPVAGVNPWMDWGADLLPGMVGPTSGEETAADWITRATREGRTAEVTGAGLPGGAEGTNASFEATRRAFEAMTIPQIRQQRTLMGLGDSNAVTNDISRAWAGVLPSLVEGELGREERQIDRSIGAGFGGAQGMAGLSAQEMQRRFGAADRGFGYGTGFRGVAEEGNRAIYEDFIRRQGLAERLLFAPFGQAGASIGSRVDQGGWFK